MISVGFKLLWIDFQLMFNWFQFIFNWVSIDSIYLQLSFNWPASLKEGGQRVVMFFSPQKFVCTIEYHPNNYIIGIWVTRGVLPWKIVWVLLFKKGLIMHLFFGEILHFEAYKAMWLCKVNGPALLKEGGHRVVMFFHPKVCAQ